MKLTTIWTLPSMSFAERLRRTRDSLLLSLGARTPRRLAYWTLIAHGAKHIRGDEEVPAVPFMTVLQRAGVGVER